MADLTITAADVQQSASAIVKSGNAGEAITAGQCVYKTAAGDIFLADANDTAAKAAAIGIAINSAPGAGQPVSYCIEDDDFTVGATVAVGTCYVVSATAGGIAPDADLITNDYATFLMIGKSTTKAYLKPLATGAQHA